MSKEKAKIVDRLNEKALAITGKNSKKYTWEAFNELWTLASDWNADHYGNDEVFMCEISKEDGYEGDGFMIEDDYYLFEE